MCTFLFVSHAVPEQGRREDRQGKQRYFRNISSAAASGQQERKGRRNDRRTTRSSNLTQQYRGIKKSKGRTTPGH